jgi:hypothetical protein
MIELLRIGSAVGERPVDEDHRLVAAPSLHIIEAHSVAIESHDSPSVLVENDTRLR